MNWEINYTRMRGKEFSSLQHHETCQVGNHQLRFITLHGLETY